MYNNEKNTCDKCGITKKEAKKHPVKTGINHPDYATTTSFYLSWDGGVLCAKCHREKELKKLFDVMDKRDIKMGKKL